METQQNLEAELIPVNQQQQPASMALIVGGAIVSALAGAVVWALIAYYGNYELGILASGVGALVGIAVAFLAKKNITQSHQIIAVIFALAGVIAGKYITFYLVKQDIIEELDKLGMSDLLNNSEYAIRFSDAFDAMDILWIVLAVAAAWTIPLRFAQRP
ncbi:inorganic phosphate transporter [Cohnella mopanensis]|uniref:inorganic phosphate transporter n=1 Tax=Cohnella mopanensis TaxID=2911966 RepID=UPI001EF77447|nr:inorganic phosphate transporter [Cohnella mopanensis]